MQVLKGHDDHVITCLQFCGNRIVSGSDDNTLKVWSAVTGEVSWAGVHRLRGGLWEPAWPGGAFVLLLAKFRSGEDPTDSVAVGEQEELQVWCGDR